MRHSQPKVAGNSNEIPTRNARVCGAATIPLYYLLGHAIDRRQPLRFVAEAYTALVVVLMVPSIGQGVFDVTWPLLLTIPLVMWAAHALSRRFQRRGQVHAGVASTDASADAPSDMA